MTSLIERICGKGEGWSFPPFNNKAVAPAINNDVLQGAMLPTINTPSIFSRTKELGREDSDNGILYIEKPDLFSRNFILKPQGTVAVDSTLFTFNTNGGTWRFIFCNNGATAAIGTLNFAVDTSPDGFHWLRMGTQAITTPTTGGIHAIPNAGSPSTLYLSKYTRIQVYLSGVLSTQCSLCLERIT